MFSELGTALTHTVITTSITATTLVAVNPTSISTSFAYDQPLFTCEKGMVLYRKIQQNNNISSAQRQEMIKTLIGDMPKNCIHNPDNAKVCTNN